MTEKAIAHFKFAYDRRSSNHVFGLVCNLSNTYGNTPIWLQGRLS